MKKQIEKFKNENIAINTETQQEYDELMELFDEYNIRWGTDKRATRNNFWGADTNETCINYEKDSNCIMYSPKDFYLKEGFNVIKYKDFIKDYHGQDYFGTTHVVAMIVLTLLIITLLIVFRNAKTESVDKFLKILSIIVPVLETVKIVWESYFDIKMGHGFNWTGLLPLYTCSLFIYTLPLAAWTKGKVKEVAVCWLGTIGVFGGLTA